MGINILSWVVPSLAGIMLDAMGVQDRNIYELIMSTSIELGSCAMCPALYGIKLGNNLPLKLKTY
jgi:hypothetical protein